jgi:hypothetical protein
MADKARVAIELRLSLDLVCVWAKINEVLFSTKGVVHTRFSYLTAEDLCRQFP